MRSRGGGDPPKRGLQAEAARRIEASGIVATLKAERAPDMEAWEEAVLTEALAAGARALEAVLAAVGAGRRERPVLCGCGGRMASVGRRTKTLTTLLGPARFTRSLFRCPDCGETAFPGDEALGVAGTGFSPGVRRRMARAGARTSFADAEEDLLVYGRIRVSARDIERVAEETGRRIEAWRLRLAPEEGAPDTLYIEYDGTGVPVRRSETEGRRGRGPDGAARTREVKLGCVFTQTATDDEGRPVRDEDSASYVAGIESSALFGERIHMEAVRRGIGRARRVVIITDGAAYNLTIASTHFPGALHIVDWYHALEHLAALEALLPDPGRGDRWRDLLHEGRIEDLAAEAGAVLPRSGPRRAAALKEIAYFRRNAVRMRYAEFRARGLFIGSGVIEAGCRTVVCQRLKQSGMFWSVRGAQAILQARCAILSRLFDDYWDDLAAA